MNCLLFVPGARPDRFAKALVAGADAICIDLEDAVAAPDKLAARDAALGWLAANDAAPAWLRINALSTHDGLADLLALVGREVRPHALLLPKVESARDIAIVRELVPEMPLVPLVESAAGLRAVTEIARAPGVVAAMFGGGDLSAELGVELAWEPLRTHRDLFLLGCAGAGVSTIDVPFVHLEDPDGLARESASARAAGFSAKAAIHPAQVEPIRRAFAPSEAERRAAAEALAAFEAGGGRAVRHKGRMLEAPLVRRLREVVDA